MPIPSGLRPDSPWINLGFGPDRRFATLTGFRAASRQPAELHGAVASSQNIQYQLKIVSSRRSLSMSMQSEKSHGWSVITTIRAGLTVLAVLRRRARILHVPAQPSTKRIKRRIAQPGFAENFAVGSFLLLGKHAGWESPRLMDVNYSQ